MKAGDNLAASEEKRLEALQLIEDARRAQSEGHEDQTGTLLAKAWTKLEESLALCAANHRTRFLLVNCAMNADNYERAKVEGLRIYQDLSGEQLRRMDDAVLHLSVAHASKMLGDTEDAIKFASEATQLYATDPHPHMILGEIYESMGRDEEAEFECREALRHNGSHHCRHPLNTTSCYFTHCCLGATLIKQDKHVEAEDTLVEATRLLDSSTLAWRHLCDAYHFQGRRDDALKVAHKIAKMDPDDHEIRLKIDALENPGSEDASLFERGGRRHGGSRPGSVRSHGGKSAGNHGIHGGSRAASNHGGYRHAGGSEKGSHGGRSHRSGRGEEATVRTKNSDKLEARDEKDQGKNGFFFCCMDRG